MPLHGTLLEREDVEKLDLSYFCMLLVKV
jgi:hypothetical protein